MSRPLPDHWPVPAWNATAPQPCTKAMLLAWLGEHHNLGIASHAPMETVGEWIVPQLGDIYATGRMPPLLSSGL